MPWRRSVARSSAAMVLAQGLRIIPVSAPNDAYSPYIANTVAADALATQRR